IAVHELRPGHVEPAEEGVLIGVAVFVAHGERGDVARERERADAALRRGAGAEAEGGEEARGDAAGLPARPASRVGGREGTGGAEYEGSGHLRSTRRAGASARSLARALRLGRPAVPAGQARASRLSA